MIDTTRIRSGFDVELMLGAGWFLTAFRALHERGLLLPEELPAPIPPDPDITIDDIQIIFDPDRDLLIKLTINQGQFDLLASLAISDDGSELIVTTNIDGMNTTVPLGVFDDLAGVPVLQKVAGDSSTDPAMALLANLDLRASPQSEDPLPADEHVVRGDASQALSFLPTGKDTALGVGTASYPRFANDIWHEQLRADDGSHPLPDADDPKGEWSVVSMTPLSGRIRVVLEGDIPVDSPIIDIVPDPHVTITLDLVPTVTGGQMIFDIEIDTDVDTGLLGDLFAFLVGGFVGFIIGIFTGGALLLAGTFAVGSVIALEVAEVIVEGIVQRQIRARIGGAELVPLLACQSGNVVEATPVSDEEDSLSLGPLDAIPRSVVISTDEPDALHSRTVVVTSQYDELQMDASGLGVAGMTVAAERFQPLGATLSDRTYEGDRLVSLTYRASGGTSVTLPIEEVFTRMSEAELKGPYELGTEADDASIRTPEGRLPSVCLSAQAIRRKKTIVTDIQFTTGVDLKVSDTIALQDAGAVILREFQLIHPQASKAYYRAIADDSTENNFESLPQF